jgi:DNA polymerase theta
LSPEEGLLVYLDIQRAQKNIILSNELHLLYLLSPVSLSFHVNWKKYHLVFKQLAPVERRICNLIGIDEDSIVAFGEGVGSSNMNFKREIELRESATAEISPTR